MSRVNAGAMTMRREDGFDMIDVAPDSPRQAKSNEKPAEPKPASKPTGQKQPAQSPEHFEVDERDTFGDWRAARASTARTRKAPLMN